MNQPEIGDVLLGGDAADLPHEPGHKAAHAHKTVCGADNTEMLGEQNPVGDLHIQKAGVVHQDQAGLFFELLQALSFVFEFSAGHAENRQNLDEDTPEKVRLFRIFMLGPGQSHDFVIVHMLDADLHRGTSFQFTICSLL